MSDAKFLEVAIDLGEQAAALIRGFFDGPIHQEKKADNSPVTEADIQSDRLIREGLAKNFPEHSVLTEETGLVLGKDLEWTWVVDPLDGTKAFANKIPGFCVMIGLLRRGKPYLGVVVDPLTKRRYEAVLGQGAYQFWQGKRHRLNVSTRQNFNEMPLVISTGFPPKELEIAFKKLNCPLVDPINSVGIKIGLLMRQVGDIYLNHHGVYYWDTCAPQILLAEAGGIFTRLDGDALGYELEAPFSHHSPTLASNGTRHEELLKLCQDLGLAKT